jgi:hypothetical protein
MNINETDQEREAMIDATLEDTFPASDPPAWTLGREPHYSSGLIQPVPSIPKRGLTRKSSPVKKRRG